MNSKERIFKALDKKVPDKVPTFELLIDEASILKLAKILINDTELKELNKQLDDNININYIDNNLDFSEVKTRFGEESLNTLELSCLIVEKLNLDSLTTYISTGIKTIDKDTAIDKFGTKYHLSEHGQPLPFEGPINDINDTIGFDMTKKISKGDFFGPEYIVKRLGTNRAVFLLLSDPFKISWKLRGGMEKLLLDYAIDKNLVHKLQSIATDYNLAAIEYASNIGIDALAVEGDLAGNNSLLVSPSHFKEYIKPYLKKIVDFAHDKKLRIIKHSDGNIWQILDDLIEIGFDGIHPIQPQCMDIKQVKDYLKSKMCIIGNIDCEELLPFGSIEEVKQVVKNTIEIAAPSGGYIISSSNSIHPGVKPENFIAMIEAVQECGWY